MDKIRLEDSSRRLLFINIKIKYNSNSELKSFPSKRLLMKIKTEKDDKKS